MTLLHRCIAGGRAAMRASSGRMRAALLALGLAVAPPLLAHDVWIEPTSFSPLPGQSVGVRLRVGVNLVGDPVPRIPGLVNQFVVAAEADRRPVVGSDGADPAGIVRIAAPGLHVIGYHSNPSRIELPAQKFNDYLKEEGLESIIALRASRGESDALARELYARCAKSLVLSGPASDAQADRRLGFPLELVAERNPYALRAGEPLPVRLHWGNRPLAGALVVAQNASDPSRRVEARTDRDGRVALPLPAIDGGMWLVKAVHMVTAPAGWDAEWSSYWASLTFASRATAVAQR
jgi:hypothetical protein